MQGTASLYKLARDTLDHQLRRFEAYALETCLRVPDGLMPDQVCAPKLWTVP